MQTVIFKQVATIDYDEFVGRIAVVASAAPAKGETLFVWITMALLVSKSESFDWFFVPAGGDLRASAGDTLVLLALPTLCPENHMRPASPEALPPSPLMSRPFQWILWLTMVRCRAGWKACYVPQVTERLYKELQSNVSLKAAGRELHLGILIETMRREGYELTVSMPKVIVREDENGRAEPYEDVSIDW